MASHSAVIKNMRTRRTVRGYQPGPVTRGQLETLVDCARLAPSALNEQTWEFVVVTSHATLAEIARLAPENCPFLTDAAACVVVAGRGDNRSVYLDGAAATQNILLAAHAMGLGCCWVQAYEKPYSDSVRELLGIPSSHVLCAMVSIGVPFGEVETPPKRELASVLHWEKY